MKIKKCGAKIGQMGYRRKRYFGDYCPQIRGNTLILDSFGVFKKQGSRNAGIISAVTGWSFKAQAAKASRPNNPLLQHIIHIPVIAYLASCFQHTHVFGILQKFAGKDETVEAFIFAEDDLFIGAAPFFTALVHV